MITERKVRQICFGRRFHRAAVAVAVAVAAAAVVVGSGSGCGSGSGGDIGRWPFQWNGH